MKKLGFIFIALGFILGFSVIPYTPSDYGFIISGGVAKAAGGGPIVLDGMDPVCHAAYGENTDQYIAKVVKSVYTQSSMPGNNGKISILGVPNVFSAGGCGGNWNTLLSTKFLSEFSTAPSIEFISTDAELNTFFSTTITSNPPRMLWIPDEWGRSGATGAIFTANAEKIADFVNSGGGIFSSHNSYGWLTALLPSAVYNNGGCNGGPEATADGIADFGLSNSIVAACWHGYFTGNVGTLKVLVDYPYPTASSTRKAVSIGGGSVSLPSSFTLSLSPESPRAGEDLIITATAQTISGVPQAGVLVTVTVSSGPDSGQVLSATTNASGIATITVRTSSTGTAVYTATATVNGVAKTVSATVTWNPPVTTIAPSTTTTLAPTTTVEPSTTVAESVPPAAPSTTSQQEVLPAAEETAPTTIPEIDAPEEQHLPSTGLSVIIPLLISFQLIVLGMAMIKGKRITR